MRTPCALVLTSRFLLVDHVCCAKILTSLSPLFPSSKASWLGWRRELLNNSTSEQLRTHSMNEAAARRHQSAPRASNTYMHGLALERTYAYNSSCGSFATSTARAKCSSCPLSQPPPAGVLMYVFRGFFFSSAVFSPNLHRAHVRAKGVSYVWYVFMYMHAPLFLGVRVVVVAAPAHEMGGAGGRRPALNGGDREEVSVAVVGLIKERCHFFAVRERHQTL